MQCWGHIPINISEIYTQLLLVDVEAELRTGRFCNVSWNSIEHLSIELLNSKHIFRLDNIRKPICDIVFCVIDFDVLTFYFCILCIMLHILNGAIHEVEPRWRRG